MAWSEPRTWVTAELVTAAMMNEQVRDNMDDVDDRLDNLNYPLVTASSVSYTLVLADAGKLVEFTSTGGVTLTIPSSSGVAFVANTQIVVRQKGAGQVTVAAASTGITLQSPDSYVRTRVQYSTVGLIKRGTKLWALLGDLESS